ncbi:MAG: Plug domain-containing protein [Bacteroidota bacterium]
MTKLLLTFLAVTISTLAFAQRPQSASKKRVRHTVKPIPLLRFDTKVPQQLAKTIELPVIPQSTTVYIISSCSPPIRCYQVQSHLPAMYNDATTYTLTRKEIAKQPYTDIDNMLASYPGIYQRQRGGGLTIYGGTGNLYVVDGMQVMR